MKNLRLVFEEKETKEKQHGQKQALLFKGHWDNNSSNPEVTFKISKCEDSDAETILADLDIFAPGEVFFLSQGENPQKRLDHWLKSAVRRKAPKVADFENEIKDFDEFMIGERRDSLFEQLSTLIEAKKEGTKKFGFLLECYNTVSSKVFGYDWSIAKDELIANVRGLDTAYADESDDWEVPTDDEEE